MIGSVKLAPWAIIIVDTWMWTPYVMLICLAGPALASPTTSTRRPRSTAPRRGASSGRITLPMVLPFIMLAVLFRGIENFKMFDLVNLLTNGGPGSTTEVASITLKREAFEKWRTGYSSALAIILFVAVFGLANIYVKALNAREEPLSTRCAPALSTAHSVVEPTRASQVASRWRSSCCTRCITLVPLVWILLTSIKSAAGLDQLPAQGRVQPSIEGYCNLFTTRSRQTARIHREPAAGGRRLRQALARARQHGRGRAARTTCRASSTR